MYLLIQTGIKDNPCYRKRVHGIIKQDTGCVLLDGLLLWFKVNILVQYDIKLIAWNEKNNNNRTLTITRWRSWALNILILVWQGMSFIIAHFLHLVSLKRTKLFKMIYWQSDWAHNTSIIKQSTWPLSTCILTRLSKSVATSFAVNCLFLHATEWIPGGDWSIFTVDVLKWIVHRRMINSAQTASISKLSWWPWGQSD